MAELNTLYEALSGAYGMKSIEIESWAVRVLERVEKHLAVEDSRVECKREWPDPAKAARRLAGHANAARGENILWLIGADEKQGTVTGANYQDLATWFPQVKACFESEVPMLQDLHVTAKGKTVAALCFDTSRLPYLVKNPAGGTIQFEVPWREGTAVRTAARSDLILMLGPLVKAPKLELLEGQLTFESGVYVGGLPNFQFTLTAYIATRNSEPMVFPYYKCSAQLLAGSVIVAESFRIRIETPKSRLQIPAVKLSARALENTDDELVVRGAGKIVFYGTSGFAQRYSGEDDLELRLTMVEATSDLPIAIAARFSRIKDGKSKEQPNRWSLTR
jgi:hypothetical protein